MTAVAALFPGVPPSPADRPRPRTDKQTDTQVAWAEQASQPTGARARLIAYARTFMGVPYEINLPGFPRQPGGRGFGKRYPELDKGLDCSGYVLKVLQNAGLLVDLNPDFTSCDTLWTRCVPIEAAATLPGDLVFFRGTYNTPGLSHIGFVIDAGGRTMISARTPGVGIDPLTGGFWQRHVAGFGTVKGFSD